MRLSVGDQACEKLVQRRLPGLTVRPLATDTSKKGGEYRMKAKKQQPVKKPYKTPQAEVIVAWEKGCVLIP